MHELSLSGYTRNSNLDSLVEKNMIIKNDYESILFCGFSDPYLLDVTKYLSSHYAEIVLLAPHSVTSVTSLPSNFTYVNYDYLYHSDTVSLAFNSSDKEILDACDYAYFYECKSYFFRILDRLFLLPLSSYQQEYFFRELLSYWIGYLKNRPSIKKIVFHCVPHFPADIVLFYVARFLHRNTVIIRRTAISTFIVLSQDFRASDSHLIKISNPKIKPGNQVITDMSKREGFAIRNSKRIMKLSDNITESSKLPFLKQKVKLLREKKYLITRLLNKLLDSKWYSYRIMPKEMFLFRIKRVIQVFNSIKWLSCYAVKPNFSEKYVYFPLHFRPERSTVPEANEFFDQVSCISLISAVIPDDWKIYVKEHPRQLDDIWDPDLRRTNFPETHLYVRISKVPKTVFVPTNTSSSKLIQYCQITASCTGSTVWEGLNMGKPGITFGDTWHSACVSSPVIQTKEDLKSIFPELSQKTKEQVIQDLENFLGYLQDYIVESAYCYSSAISSNLDYSILIRNLSLAIASV